MTNREKREAFIAHMKRARLGRNSIKTYLGIFEAFGLFCKGRHFSTGQDAVCSFLSSFSDRNLSAASQNQALNALAGKNGLYHALGKPLGQLPKWVKASRPTTVPVWVTQSETEAIASHLEEPWALMINLMFGSGLRIGEVTALRWRDIDFERMTITVHQGKGKKDRITFLPRCLVDPLRLRFRRCRALHGEDRANHRAGVQIPDAIANKSPRAGEQLAFFWVFPSAKESRDPATGIIRRHHIHKKSLSRPTRIAVSRAGIPRKVTAHSFRHGFATAYLMTGGHIRELRDLLGHQSIQTTEIYLHCLPTFTDRVGSPLDQRPTVVPFTPASSSSPQSAIPRASSQ